MEVLGFNVKGGTRPQGARSAQLKICETASAESAVGVESGAVRSMCANSLSSLNSFSGEAGCQRMVSGI